MSKEQMKVQVEQLLDIYAPSGKEEPVRAYLMPILNDLMDTVEVDEAGNILAVKTISSGEGAVIMLSAHMDTVSRIKEEKVVIEENGIYTAILPNGERTILGADDRAGIAIVLETLRNIPESFNGTVKVAFSVMEEVGCVGAEKIDFEFYSDVDLAIIIDRKGSKDIVTGCANAFCSNVVGDFIEKASDLAGLSFECVEGGVSDAMTFSQRGINSINLSAGYYFEHTKGETLSFSEMQDTVKLIQSIFNNANDYYDDFGHVPSFNNWVVNYHDEDDFEFIDEENELLINNDIFTSNLLTKVY